VSRRRSGKNAADSPIVTADVILRGALYSLQQCGLLLNDAATLFDAKRYPTAAGLALLGHEDLGRYRILLKLWPEAVSSGGIRRDEVVKRLREHVDRQRAGLLGLGFSIEKDSRLDKLASARTEAIAARDFERIAELLSQIEDIDQRLAGKRPHDRTVLRVAALYVDLTNDGTRWRRPADLTREQSAKELRDAINDYAVQKGFMERRHFSTIKPLPAQSADSVIGRRFLRRRFIRRPSILPRDDAQ
jgi:AbiV family abortive infection protein